MSVENLTGYNDILCEFALLLLSYLIEPRISRSLCATREITVFVTLQQHMKYTLSRTKIRENH